jgi:hypothetical protein
MKLEEKRFWDEVDEIVKSQGLKIKNRNSYKGV